MKRMTIASLGVLAMILIAGALPAAERGGNAKPLPLGPAKRHVKIALVPVDGSGATGFVHLTQLPHGDMNINVVVKGLTPGAEYGSFYHESSDCSGGHDPFGTFTADLEGEGHVHAKIEADLSQIGSVSVRLGPDFGALLACAAPAGATPTAPRVISTVPANGASGVALGGLITATFSEAMNPATINPTSFTLQQGATPVAGTVGYSGVTATFMPASNLAPLTVYTATITTGARDLAGDALVSHVVWTFTTGSTLDGTAPTVSSTIPVPGASGVTISGTVAAIFSEAMDPATIGAASFTLQRGTTPVVGTVGYAGVTATLTPTAHLAPLTVYTATITTGVRDLAGNALFNNFSWSFTTGSTPDVTRPTVILTVPANGATAVGINQAVNAAFSEAMNPATIGAASFTLQQGTTSVAGTVSYAGVTATFTPASTLAPVTVYTATVTTGVRDLAGNALFNNFSWSFTTGSTPDVTRPTVILTVPTNGATAVGINQAVNATFSEAMDPLTISTASVTLRGPGGIGVVGTVGYAVAGRIATFTPGINLAPMTAYTATITTGARDLAGNALAANFVWSFTTASTPAGQAPVVLGSATTFVVLAGSTVTNTGASAVNGDLGLSPGTAVTGFPPGIVNGAIHAGDPAAAQAQLDLTIAYDDAAGRTVGAIPLAGNLGGLTLVPGLYKSTSSLEISSGDLTLDAQGDANAVFIFQIASTLTTTSARQVILSGGAKASNVFWQVGSSATLGTGSMFKGTILALASISVTTGAAVEGRLLARTAAVTLDASVVGLAIPAGPVASTDPASEAARVAISGITGVANRVSLAGNPLRSGLATIRFGLARADRVEIKVYDVSGRVVRSLVNRAFESGEHEVVWDGLDSSGRRASRGLYFTKVAYGDQAFVATKKLTIIE